MTSEDTHGRLTKLEVEMSAVKKTLDECRAETQVYRDKLAADVASLSRIVFVGMGILITLQFAAPFILKSIGAVK